MLSRPGDIAKLCPEFVTFPARDFTDFKLRPEFVRTGDFLLLVEPSPDTVPFTLRGAFRGEV